MYFCYIQIVSVDSPLVHVYEGQIDILLSTLLPSPLSSAHLERPDWSVRYV